MSLEYTPHSGYHVNDLLLVFACRSICSGVSVSVGPHICLLCIGDMKVRGEDMVAFKKDLGFVFLFVFGNIRLGYTSSFVHHRRKMVFG